MTSRRLRPSPAWRSIAPIYRALERRVGIRARVHVITHLAHRARELFELLGRQHAHEVLVEMTEVHRHRGLDTGEAGRGERGIGDPAVRGALLAHDELGLLETIDRPREAARGERDLRREVAHPQAVPGRPGQAQEHFEPLGGELALLGEPTLERGGQTGVGLEEEAGGGEALVVEGGLGGHAPRLSGNTCMRNDRQVRYVCPQLLLKQRTRR